MAPNTLTGWSHPYTSPFVLYADGGDDPAPDPAGTDPDPDGTADVEPDDAWTPPTREEYEKLTAEKAKASAEAANRRKWLRAAGYDPKTGNKLEPDEPDPAPAVPKPQDPNAAPAPVPGMSEADVKRLVDKAVTETQLRGRRQMHSFTVGFNEELAKAGWNGSRLGHLMRLLDFDDIDVDDDGEITGLAEQIENLKTDWPEFFKRNRSNPSKPGAGSGQDGTPAGNVDLADKKPPAPEPKGWAETVADRLMRG